MMMQNSLNPNVDYLKDHELIGVKRRMLANSESEGIKVRELDTCDFNQERFRSKNFSEINKQMLDAMTAVDIVNHTIYNPNIPLKYKYTNEKQGQMNHSMENPRAKRQLVPMQTLLGEWEKSNFTPLAIRNDHIYKLKNAACSCPLQGINYKYSEDMINQVTGPIKILCPIHSGHPIHESIRIGRVKNTKSVFGSNQADPTILQHSDSEKIIIVKELSLACKYRMISHRQIHILYILSLLSSTNQVSMFQLSSPLQSISYVVLKDLHLQPYFINSKFKSSTYNGPALFIATTDEFRIATMPDSLGNTKGMMNQKYISRMHIIIRQRNYGVYVSKIMCHETTGRIFILDGSNSVYEFVYQYRSPGYSSMSFAFLKPLKVLWSSLCTITQYANSLLNMRGDVIKYTVNPVEINVTLGEHRAVKPLNHSCLNDRLDISIKNSVLYYPPVLWEAITPEVIANLKNHIVKTVCNCGAVDPCMSVPINYGLKVLNPWYFSRSVRSNSTIIDGFVDKTKNILVVLFLNGDIIVYTFSSSIDDENNGVVQSYMIRGDQIQYYLSRMNYRRYVGNTSYFSKDLKKYYSISVGSKVDELVVNCENVVAVLSDEFGTRIYIGFSGGYTTASDGSLVRVTNETGNPSSAKTNPTLVVKGYRLLPPHFSPEGFTSENADNHLADMFNMYHNIHKTFRIYDNEYAMVQVGVQNPVGRKLGSKTLFQPTSSSATFGAIGHDIRDVTRIDSNTHNVNPLTAGPIISGSFGSNKASSTSTRSSNMYKITIAVGDKHTYSEVSSDDQGLPRTIWNSLNNISGCSTRNTVKQVEWYDQFYLYLGADEKLVSMFMNGSFGNDALGTLIIITTYHVYSIQRQSLYSLMEDAINNPIAALEAYDKKALNYFPKWLESSQNTSKVPKFSNLMDLKVSNKEVDILDIAANKKYLNKDASDQLKISEMQCVGFLFYLFSWMYSPQVFFSIIWKLLVNYNAIKSSNANLKHYCSNLIFPEYINDVRLSLMCNSLGIYSKQYNWSVFTMEDKIYPWPKMLYFGSTTYFRTAKISTNAISPIVEGLLLFVSELFEDIWFLKLFPSSIKQFSQLSYKMAGEGETQDTQNAKHKLLLMLKDYFSLQPNYKKLYDQIDSLSELLKISIVCNSRDTFKEAICDALAIQILDDFAHDWQNLIATDIRTHRSKLMKYVSKYPSDDLFGSNLLTRSNQDVNQEYIALKGEFASRFDKDISLLNECNVLMDKAKTYILGAIIFQCCILDNLNVNKFINVYETSQKAARVDYSSFSLEKICTDVVFEKEFSELVKRVKNAFNIT
ncbi:hypothetical protein BmR1_04g05370 [Babesia microti strain RI]|uniref:Uncharacterized protein n=1 Tax=Babesia microti (strain RI) TaxID=1133968 RepID=I7IH65_BABMR|nr:hypothetical protein BmR1_04g05370 [Babesia microti strain RI]CCF75272.1 hypothetical protein BmR1_04g05370 [Babesia microti strain RI]|eukprot:XP_012649680.1 hypothetical protein BmR1_04g05370 [Babesia microti strain RI]